MLSAEAFDSINASATPENVEVWSAEEERAQSERVHDVAVMDIYDIKMKRRECNQAMLVLPDIRV
jgi:hypothetical protein